MLSDAELEALATDVESFRAERTVSWKERDKIGEAICAFANDLPDSRLPGVLFIGLHDRDGSPSGLTVTDELLKTLADFRSDGRIVPIPTIHPYKWRFRGADVAVVEVLPALAPPVRYGGKVHVRIGPRRGVASADEERRLSEKRRSLDVPFELRSVPGATLEDLDLARFADEILPAMVAPDVLEANGRTPLQQLVSLRFATGEGTPTALGILLAGKDPQYFIPCATMQFLRVAGTGLDAPIVDQKEIGGTLQDQMREIDQLVRINVRTRLEIGAFATDVRVPDYPAVALTQLLRNALIHRNYENTHAPCRWTWFEDRIEIVSPGGPYGSVTQENFGQPGVTDYRNLHVASALKEIGFVQKFGAGIGLARKHLAENGNAPAEFAVSATHVMVTLRPRT